MSKQSIRAERRQARANRIIRQRILLAVLALFILITIGVFAFSRLGTDDQNVTVSGLVIEDITVGTGPEAQPGDTVSVHYTGTFVTGQTFDSSLERGTPFTFTLGRGDVIQGWDEGVQGMKVGGKRKLIVPPELAYGAAGYPPVIPENATLIFEVELLEIVQP
jgi:FKBP-type peptidyl-prolyl cis-trans isomerase